MLVMSFRWHLLKKLYNGYSGWVVALEEERSVRLCSCWSKTLRSNKRTFPILSPDNNLIII